VTALVFEIPTQSGAPQIETISLNGVTYTLTIFWCDPDGVWMLNIADSTGTPIVSGLPLITGADMLEQYEYLGIGGMLLAQTDFDWTLPPTFTNLGSTGHLYFVPAISVPASLPVLPLAPGPETPYPEPGFTLPQPSPPGPTPPVVDSVAFTYFKSDTPTKLTSSGLTNLPDTSPTFLLAGWIANTDGVVLLLDTGVAGVGIQVTETGGNSTWFISAYDSSGDLIFTGDVVVAIDTSVGWHSYAISVDTSTQALQLLVDSDMVYNGSGTDADFTWSSSAPVGYFDDDGWRIGELGSIFENNEFSSYWFGAGFSFFDLTVSDNVTSLFGTVNCWQDWGPDGSGLNGFQPQIFLYGVADDYPSNLGTGGPFTVVGTALTAGADQPTACS
jgi:hypothetical protein